MRITCTKSEFAHLVYICTQQTCSCCVLRDFCEADDRRLDKTPADCLAEMVEIAPEHLENHTCRCTQGG